MIALLIAVVVTFAVWAAVFIAVQRLRSNALDYAADQLDQDEPRLVSVLNDYCGG